MMNRLKWGGTLLLVSVMLAGSGCGKKAEQLSATSTSKVAPPSPTQETSVQAQQDPPNKAYRSAAYAGFQGETFASEAEMKALLQQAVSYFNAQPLDQLVAKGGNGAPGEVVPAFSNAMTIGDYHSVKPNAADEVPILVLAIGQGVNTLNAHGLFWYEQGTWHAQPYPQLPKKWAQSRAKVFQNANIGYGNFAELHQEGNRLAVVYSFSGTRIAQEVHLLERVNGVWRMLWMPTYENWQELLNTRIEFNAGIDTFTAYHRDEKHPTEQWQDEWKLQGDQYVKVSSTKR